MNTATAPAWVPSFLVPFCTLSYPLPTPPNPDSFPEASYYGTGPLDLCIVLAWIGVLGIVRDFIRVKVFEPLGRWYLIRQELQEDARRASTKASNGHANGAPEIHQNGTSAPLKRRSARELFRERAVLRFGEQGYQWTYFVIYWSYGLYLHYNFPHSPWRLDYLWKDYPHFPLAAPVKFYYLTQAAFWIHSVLVLHAEEHRKDHVQMMLHHFVTIPLLGASYIGNYTRVGCIIMFITDWCDIWLPFAKMFRYLGFANFCDVLFAWFLVSWVATRQVLFSLVLYSVYTSTKFLRFEWNPAAGYYLTPALYVGFLALLGTLLVMMCMWAMIMYRVALKVLRGQPADDARSDDEDDFELEDEDESKGRSIVETESVIEPVSQLRKKNQ